MVYTYLMTDGFNYKIGKSKDPFKRLVQLRTANINLFLLCCGVGISEKQLHINYADKNIKLEWYSLDQNEVDKIIDLIFDDEFGWSYFKSNNVYFTFRTQKLNANGLMSDGCFAFLNKVINRNGHNPYKYNGAVIEHKLPYFKERYGKTTFFKYKKELLDLNIIIDYGKNYYVFNPKYLNTISRVRKLLNE